MRTLEQARVSPKLGSSKAPSSQVAGLFPPCGHVLLQHAMQHQTLVACMLPAPVQMSMQTADSVRGRTLMLAPPMKRRRSAADTISLPCSYDAST